MIAGGKVQGPSRVALVTGAGSGIGRAVALALGGAGYAVVLAGRRAERLQSLRAEIEALGASALAQPADVSDPASVRKLFESAEARFGRLDLLFNNAGIFSPAALIEDVPYEQWMAVLQANLTGAFLCTQEAIRLMKRQDPRGGRIINNGSLSAQTPRPMSAPYTASKHALTGLTRATVLEGRAFDIVCGQIDVGNAATDMTQAMAEGVLQADGTRKIEARMDVEHVARAVLNMAELPLEANIPFLTILASKMPFSGRG